MFAPRLLFFLAFLPWSATASDRVTAPRRLVTEREMERYGDPPAYVWRTESSPRMLSAFGNFTSYQVNIGANGANIVGDAANEPSITVDPANPSRISIGWRQFNSVNSNFRQGAFAYSTDHGASWTFPGVLSNGFRSDPVLLSDTSGSFFYLSLVPNFFDDIWRSDSGGQFWFRLGPATGGDKQWFTIDNTNGPGHGFQYQSWSSLGNNWDGRQFSRSLDGGYSWSDPIDIPQTPSWGTLDVDSQGNLFIGGLNFQTSDFWCVRSTDAKNAAVTPSFDLATLVDLGGGIGFESAINPEGLAGQVFLAADRSGTSTNDNVYMLASVQRYDEASGTDVMFARSTDHGQSFSPPFRINGDPLNQNKWHWFGTLAVAPNGRIDVVWLDSRKAANDTDSQLFYSYSADGGGHWSPNVAVSAAFNPFLGYPNQAKIGDYITIVSDNEGGNVAYCATFNGEQDIYYLRVTPSPMKSLFVIHSVARETGSITITFPSETDRTYRCEYSDTPSGPWNELQTNIPGNGHDLTVSDPGASAVLKRFYRIVLLP